MIIKRVGPLSCAKISAVLYAAIGLVIGACFSLFAVLGGLTARAYGGNSGIGAAVGIFSIVAFPIIYGAIGFIGTLICAWLYNVLAGILGGVEIEVDYANPSSRLSSSTVPMS